MGLIMLPLCMSAQTKIGYSNGDFERTDGIRLNNNEQQSAAIKNTGSKTKSTSGKENHWGKGSLRYQERGIS